MDVVATLKAEIKAWERDFRAQNGRIATVEDIKALPHIAEKYKLYKKVTKEADARNATERRKLEPPKTPPRARPNQAHAVPSAAILSKSRPVTSAPDATTKNPFSPVKRKEGNASASGNHMNPFLTPVKAKPLPSRDPSPPLPVPQLVPVFMPAPGISKAKKRLHGEPVSPSPNPPEKRRRLEAANLGSKDRRSHSPSQPVEDEGDSFADDSPVKAPESGRAFKPLFEEGGIRAMMPLSQHVAFKSDSRNRSKAFARSKTMPGGLFGGVSAGKDARSSLDLEDFDGDLAMPYGTPNNRKQKGKEREQVVDGAQKAKFLPGPKGLIPSKDDLFEPDPPAGPSSAVLSRNSLPSRKRSLSEATKDDKTVNAIFNAGNLLPPSPPPAGDSHWHKANVKGRAKARDVGKGKGKNARVSPVASDKEDNSEDAEVKMIAWRGRPPSPRPTTDNGTALEVDSELRFHLRGRQTSPPASPLLEMFEVDLPEEMRRVLALSPNNREREREEEDLVKDLVKGTRKGGGEVWGPGEIGWEGRESDGELVVEDDWEGEGTPWEVAEL